MLSRSKRLINTRFAILLLVILFTLAIQVYNFDIFRINLDEGMLLSSAMKVADGQVMYRDFFEFWTPGAVYVVGWMIKIFGANWWVDRIIHVSLIVVYLIVAHLTLTRLRFSPKQHFLALFIAALIIPVYYTVNIHWFGQIGLLTTLYCALQFSQKDAQQQKWIGALGIAAGSTAVFSQYEGAAAIVAGGITIFHMSAKSDRINNLGRFAAVLIAIALLMAVIFLSHQSLSSLLYSTIIFPLAQYGTVNIGLPSVIWFCQTFLLVMFLLMHRQSGLSSEIRILAIFACTAQLVGLVHKGIYLAMFSGFIVNVLLIWWLGTCTAQASRLEAFSKKLLSTDLKRFIGISLSCLVGLVYVAIVGSLTFMGWQSHLLPRDRYDHMELPMGKVRMGSYTAEKIASINAAMQPQFQQGQKIYFGPFSPHYSFIFNTQNPTSYSQLTPNYNPDWMFNHAVSELQINDVQYIVLLPSESSFIFDSHNPLALYTQENYEKVAEVYLDRKLEAPKMQHSSGIEDGIWKLKD